ncbi:hypothetical protein BDV95DRAFT_610358 [Massariosphaeria phaeospora]|uniref:Uncharacterized protein n=1 Tax=Massariosphaeria phaeospora TaxID=100035 RepID=A0A7C8M4X5_9PLEO|nr:hypothetical protein BDV95DRAFT_610358 [Massariosphaeria phaeospora]
MPDYPGLGLDLRYDPWDEQYPIGAHGSCSGSKSGLLPVREVAMMNIMDRLTDKNEWYNKVFDNEIVSKWRKEALAIPDDDLWKLATSAKSQYDTETSVEPTEGIMNATTFDVCIEELRSKAKYYEKCSIVPTLEACASIAKSDRLVSSELHELLRNAFDKLKNDQSSSPDWHPNSNDMVQNLVHPSMYPLVYGRSRVLKEEEVGVSNAIEKWAGKGEIIPKDDTHNSSGRFEANVGGGTVPPQLWSNTYQWLPANVAFQGEDSVKFTSYINNLHPTKYPDIYRAIEVLIKTALPLWDQCLSGAGRNDSRFGRPKNPDDDNVENWIPKNPQDVADVEVNWDERSDGDYDPEYDDETECKWKVLRKPDIPELEFSDVDYEPKLSKRLQDLYKDSGLQIIVKMASIELTPEKPEFPAGGWHVEGQMNEQICATALYYVDSENISPSSLSFRMQTSAYTYDEYSVGQNNYSWMEQIYGTDLGLSGSCLQNYGNVETRQGRLLAFPNVFQHRVSPFRLTDPTKPGHRRFIALWLVVPTLRIISTANVPPQQQDWWMDSVFGSTTESRKAAMSKLPFEVLSLLEKHGVHSDVSGPNEGKLPLELMEMIREYFEANIDTLPMTREEAKEHRAKLMEVRGQFQRNSEDGWQAHSYSFCEH